MKKALAHFAVYLLLVTFILVRAHRRAPSKDHPFYYASWPDCFALYLKAEKETVKSGEAIMLTVISRNVTDEPCSAAITYPYNYGFSIRDGRGKRVAQRPEPESVRAYPYSDVHDWSFRILRPGQEEQETFDFSNFDLTAPGEYAVTAFRSIYCYELGISHTLISNRIKIRVVN